MYFDPTVLGGLSTGMGGMLDEMEYRKRKEKEQKKSEPLNFSDVSDEEPMDRPYKREISAELFEACNKAIDQSNEVLIINPKDPVAWSMRGIALFHLGKYEESIKSLEQSLIIDPKNALAWVVKGDALLSLNRTYPAFEAYDQALKIDSTDDVVWNKKGVALYRFGKYEESIKSFEQALIINPKDEVVWLNKGNALSHQEKYEEAIKAYDEALKIDPEYASAKKERALTLNKLVESRISQPKMYMPPSGATCVYFMV